MKHATRYLLFAAALIGCSSAPAQPPLEVGNQAVPIPNDDAGAATHPGVVPPVTGVDSGSPAAPAGEDAGPVAPVPDAGSPDPLPDASSLVDSAAPPDAAPDCSSCILGPATSSCSGITTTCSCECYSGSSPANWPELCVGETIGCTCSAGCITAK